VKFPDHPRHCDEYIDDTSAPEVLRAFLARARAPAHGYLDEHGSVDDNPYPKLFATFGSLRQRVRVVMASRLGDVGITTRHGEISYEKRVYVEMLSEFSDTP
jgi:hypothetical protein